MKRNKYNEGGKSKKGDHAAEEKRMMARREKIARKKLVQRNQNWDSADTN